MSLARTSSLKINTPSKITFDWEPEFLTSFLFQESPIILRDGNGTIYPMAKDCMGGIRDPDWLDLPPISSLGMGVHSLVNLPANSTIKKKAAIIIMAVEVI